MQVHPCPTHAASEAGMYHRSSSLNKITQLGFWKLWRSCISRVFVVGVVGTWNKLVDCGGWACHQNFLDLMQRGMEKREVLPHPSLLGFSDVSSINPNPTLLWGIVANESKILFTREEEEVPVTQTHLPPVLVLFERQFHGPCPSPFLVHLQHTRVHGIRNRQASLKIHDRHFIDGFRRKPFEQHRDIESCRKWKFREALGLQIHGDAFHHQTRTRLIPCVEGAVSFEMDRSANCNSLADAFIVDRVGNCRPSIGIGVVDLCEQLLLASLVAFNRDVCFAVEAFRDIDDDVRQDYLEAVRRFVKRKHFHRVVPVGSTRRIGKKSPTLCERIAEEKLNIWNRFWTTSAADAVVFLSNNAAQTQQTSARCNERSALENRSEERQGEPSPFSCYRIAHVESSADAFLSICCHQERLLLGAMAMTTSASRTELVTRAEQTCPSLAHTTHHWKRLVIQ